MKKIILIISFFVPFFVQSMEINWTILENPTGKTVCGTKLGTLSHLVILNVTEGMPTGETFWSKAIDYDIVKYNGTQIVSGNSKNFVASSTIETFPHKVDILAISVIDNVGNFFGSNQIFIPEGGISSITWTPAWYLQSDGEKVPLINIWGIPAPTTGPDGWVFSGHTTPVP